jgi:hypothetical protein
MTSRILPPAEWPRLAGTELERVWPTLPRTNDVRIVVVEDEDRGVIGCWLACRVIHVEGVWIAEPYRKRTSVARRLWRTMGETIAAAFQAGGAWTGALQPDIAALLARHATPVPGQHFLLSWEKR